MKLFLSLSKVLKPKMKLSGRNQVGPKDVIAEFLGIASGEALGVDLHEGRLCEKSVWAVLIFSLFSLDS